MLYGVSLCSFAVNNPKIDVFGEFSETKIFYLGLPLPQRRNAIYVEHRTSRVTNGGV